MPEPQDQQPAPPRPVYGPPPPGTPYSQAAQPPAGAPSQLQPPAPRPAPRGGLSTGAIVGIVLGGVALLLIPLLVVAGIGLFGFFRALGPGVPGPDDGALRVAEETVESYLGAIAAGDADAALTHVWADDETAELLTDEVLGVSMELAPMSDIEVGEATGTDYGDALVPVSFRLGDERVERTFEVWSGGGDAEIIDGLVAASLYQFVDLGLSVNGVPASGELVALFPGVYEFAIDNEHFTLDGGAVIRLATPEDEYQSYEFVPVLTDEAEQTFRDLVRASLEECLAMTTLTTPCGFDAPAMSDDGQRLADGSVRRTLTADGERTLASLSAEQSYESPTAATSWDYIDVEAVAQTSDGRIVTVYTDDWLFPTVDFGEAELRVRWLE